MPTRRAIFDVPAPLSLSLFRGGASLVVSLLVPLNHARARECVLLWDN